MSDDHRALVAALKCEGTGLCANAADAIEQLVGRFTKAERERDEALLMLQDARSERNAALDALQKLLLDCEQSCDPGIDCETPRAFLAKHGAKS